MKLLIGVLLAASSGAVFPPPQVAQLDSWHTVARLCGTLEHTTHVSKKHSSQLEEKKVPFHHVHLVLYAMRGAAPCCQNLVLVGQALTDDNGRYSFKKTSPGSYWLTVLFDGGTYSYPLRYEPAKHADPDCDVFYLNLDETQKPPLNRELVVE